MARLPLLPRDAADDDALFETFTSWVSEQGIELYPAQEEAILAILTEDHAVVSTPTGSGKSLIAVAAHFFAVSKGGRSVYTAPLKALVSEKFFSLVETFGAANVGMVTGDTSVNPDAPLICCTAEILANQSLREGASLDLAQVVMDEFHFFGDPQRGWAWQVPLLCLPRTQFVLMSATLGDMSRIDELLRRRTGRPVSEIRSADRPVPLEFSYTEEPLASTLQDLVGPIYVVSFTQAAAVELAQSLTSAGLVSRERRDRIAEEIGDFRFARGFGTTLSRMLRHGIGVHHAGMLPKYRRLVEHLAQSGLLAVISGTDTLGVGINVPIRTVVLTGLTKYDGRGVRHLSAREFHQIAGRAGRAGFDSEGTVVCLAPEHVIENRKAIAKAGDDPKKRRKIVRKKAPAGFVSWGLGSFERLVAAPPETLAPHLEMNHSILMNLMARPGAGVGTVRDLIESSLADRPRQLDLELRALQIGRSLLAAGILVPVPGRPGEFSVTEDLGPAFALNQPLSPFALAALELFDPEDEDFSLDVVSVIEATVPGPRQVLSAQLNAARAEAVAAMKADGVEYAERMEALEEITWPRPHGALLEEAFASFSAEHPWTADFALEPKSVVREMIENAMTFSEFVSVYQVQRLEGTVLRYLADVYRGLVQIVPQGMRDDAVDETIAWLGETVRQVDSSLVEEWEALAHPEEAGGQPAEAAPEARALSASPRIMTRAVRNAMFRRVLLAERGDYASLGRMDGGSGWTAARWEDAVEAYFDEYDSMGIDTAARASSFLAIDEGPDTWRVRQTFADPEGDRDWGITAEVDIVATDEAGEPVVTVKDVGPLAP